MSDFIAQLKTIVGDAYVLTDADDTQPYYKEYSGRSQGNGLAVVRPANTKEVSEVVKLCAANNVPIVPQGGNTGLVGGSVPYDDKTIVLSLGRMNNFREINPDDYTMVVEAGCVLEKIQQTAQEHNRYFPLALGAQGSCQIGGNIATNAGGILSMRYGNCRGLVMGLEVVLPNGDIWDGLRSLRKDNTGYSLKHVFIGSEGTLGIITAAVIRTYPSPGLLESFFIATDSLENIVALLPVLRGAFDDSLMAYEIISRCAMDCMMEYKPDTVEPLSTSAEWYALIEVSGTTKQQIEEMLAKAFEDGLISDATIAQNAEQARAFWTIRESLSDAVQQRPGKSMKHDVAVPIAAMPNFTRDTIAAVQKIIPDIESAIFGHAGDGNLHFDLVKSKTQPVDEYISHWKEINKAVHDVVQKYNGSFAAEHGIGYFKAAELVERKSSAEIAIMRDVKKALDPQNLMNPGKVLA